MKKIFIGSLIAVMAMGCGGLQKEKSKKMTEKSTRDHLVVGDTLTTASGLKVILKAKGTGLKVDTGDKVTIHYDGFFPDGKFFDSSVKRGQPFQTKIGVGQVIKGWDEGVTMLHVGDTAQFIIPPHLGYGSAARGGIPANSTLIFDVQVIDTKKPMKIVAYDIAGKEKIKTASGLEYVVVQKGTGAQAVAGKMVTVHYTGYLTDGSKFDSSVERGDPFVFPLGQGNVIQGWDEGVALMKEGDKFRFFIPYQLGYGEGGYPPVIPEKATLVFDVELIKAQ
ncbi:MAG: FKBP-type peptidyl-prolyl cis-trans isomerase [Bacteroidetes bacterium]|nr:FKBP-type peptidyl-prolyl cis-trans isomerase [Bacteroidota bacterium]